MKEIETKLNITEIKAQFSFNGTQINHGSFGTIPNEVRSKRLEWLDKIETNVDYFMVEALNQCYDEAIQPLADYIGSPISDLVFVQNAMYGINVVLQTIGLKKDDLILYSSICYPANKLLLQSLVKAKGIKLLEIPYEPMTSEDWFMRYQEIIEKQQSLSESIKLALVDAISSVPAVVMPWERITKLLREYEIISVIDGAHCFGQLRLDLKETRPDYFITNVHKWCYSYRPTALLYVSPQMQQRAGEDGIHNIVITYGIEQSKFRDRFIWPGTIDLSTWYSAHQGLQFRKSLGESDVLKYIRELSIQAGKLLAEKFQSEILNKEKCQILFMNNVQLPSTFTIPVSDLIKGKKFEYQFYLYSKFRIKIFPFMQKWWIRLSGQIYLDLKDFDKLADELLNFIDIFNNQS